MRFMVDCIQMLIKKINDYLDHHKSAAEYPSSYNAWLRRVSSFKKLKELVLANVHQNVMDSPEKNTTQSP